MTDTAQKKPPRTSATTSTIDINAELVALHKELAQVGFTVASMLARRKLNLAGLRAASTQLKYASQAFDKSLEALDAVRQSGEPSQT